MKIFSGFSLIEVMIVVAIIGILATLAIPEFMGLVTSSKQTEAKTNLMALYTAQKVYFSSQQKYTSQIKQLAFQIPKDAKYTYTIDAKETTFTITATANLDEDPASDIWTIDQNKKLSHVSNDITD